MKSKGITFYEYVERRKQIPLFYWQRKAAEALLKEIRNANPAQGKTFLIHQLALFIDEYGDNFDLEDDREEKQIYENDDEIHVR